MKFYVEMSFENKVKLISFITVCFLISIGIISRDIGVLGNTILLSTILIFFVYSFFEYRKYREFKELEEKFPIFLKDLTEALSTGINLPKAILHVSKNDYGLLNKEIKWIANQLTWNIPINKVLERFANRMKRSKRISIAIRILRESYMSGGDTIAVLTSLSESFETLEQIEKERKSILNQYVLIVYAISLIFLVVVIMIQRLLIPIITNPQMVSIGLSNPCFNCVGSSCNLCEFYRITAVSIFGVEGDSFYYISIFFYLCVIQALFAGLVAGQISEGSPKAGIKHSIILVAIIIGTFLIIYRIGLVGV
ncbi:MAG: type II secretion system F family protein [Candidatus Aenigmatarchaeota archaeon]